MGIKFSSDFFPFKGVTNFGLSVTTLEDVFLRVGSNAEGDVKVIWTPSTTHSFKLLNKICGNAGVGHDRAEHGEREKTRQCPHIFKKNEVLFYFFYTFYTRAQ